MSSTRALGRSSRFFLAGAVVLALLAAGAVSAGWGAPPRTAPASPGPTKAQGRKDPSRQPSPARSSPNEQRPRDPFALPRSLTGPRSGSAWARLQVRGWAVDAQGRGVALLAWDKQLWVVTPGTRVHLPGNAPGELLVEQISPQGVQVRLGQNGPVLTLR